MKRGLPTTNYGGKEGLVSVAKTNFCNKSRILKLLLKSLHKRRNNPEDSWFTTKFVYGYNCTANTSAVTSITCLNDEVKIESSANPIIVLKRCHKEKVSLSGPF